MTTSAGVLKYTKLNIKTHPCHKNRDSFQINKLRFKMKKTTTKQNKTAALPDPATSTMEAAP